MASLSVIFYDDDENSTRVETLDFVCYVLKAVRFKIILTIESGENHCTRTVVRMTAKRCFEWPTVNDRK